MAKMGADFRGSLAPSWRARGRCCFRSRRTSRRPAPRWRSSPSRRGSLRLARFAAGLAFFPGKLLEAARYRGGFFPAPYRTGTWIAKAHGRERVEAVDV